MDVKAERRVGGSDTIDEREREPEPLPVGQRDETRDSLDPSVSRVRAMQDAAERRRRARHAEYVTLRSVIELRRQIVKRSEPRP
jgi:hypothetical protein